MIYLVIVLTLLVFTGLTVWASFVEMGVWNPVVALAIGCIKAVLVVLFFMHVKYSSKLTKLTVFCGHLHVSRAYRNDSVGLLQPRLGTVVEKQ